MSSAVIGYEQPKVLEIGAKDGVGPAVLEITAPEGGIAFDCDGTVRVLQVTEVDDTTWSLVVGTGLVTSGALTAATVTPDA